MLHTVWLINPLPLEFRVGRARYRIHGPAEHGGGRIIFFWCDRLDVPRRENLNAWVRDFQFAEWCAHPYFNADSAPQLAHWLVRHGHAVAEPQKGWEYGYDNVTWACVPFGAEYLTQDGRWVIKSSRVRENLDPGHYLHRCPAVMRRPLK